jgi:hypothetical protein
MSAKPTQGPWKVGELPFEGQPRGYEITDDDGALVAECWHRAVADLMAASPELLEALKDVVENAASDSIAMWRRARAAIAKAEGSES